MSTKTAIIVLIVISLGIGLGYLLNKAGGYQKRGIIEGPLSYPSHFIPEDLSVCAENIKTGEKFCTNMKLPDGKFTYGYGFNLEVPEGSYYVYAKTKMYGGGDYRAYYSQRVLCSGTDEECTDHTPIPVRVNRSEIVSNIDPGDWTADSY